MTPLTGGIIAAIEPGSIAADLAWLPGDRLLSLNGHALRDVIDYRFYQTDDRVVAVVDHESHLRTYEIEKDPDEDLGVTFSEGLFDRLHTCRNDCTFCFLKGLPRGLRSSLYVKDDDYRYSFLFGNFVTLTNLTEADWQRIGEQSLTPLHVSIHATDTDLRRRLLGNPRATDVLDQLRRLGSLRIQAHTQIVLTPPHNTGAVLERTVRDLADLYPTVQSIGIVPVGLTCHSNSDRSLTSAEADEIVRSHRAWRREFESRLGVALVYLADEMFLRAGRHVPGRDYYEGFPQLENGIGLLRSMQNDWLGLRRRADFRRLAAGRLTLVCGTLMAPTLERMACEWNARAPAQARILPVTNRLFGETVTVSGLLAGRDVLEALGAPAPEETVVLPRAMFDAAGAVTLDDLTVDAIRSELGGRLLVAGTFGELFRLLSERQ